MIEGIHTNHTESVFARVRGGLLGSDHKMEKVWLDLYAGEFA